MQDLATNENFPHISMRRVVDNSLETDQIPPGLRYLIRLVQWLVADQTINDYFPVIALRLTS